MVYRKSLEIFPPTAQPSAKITKKVSFFQTLVLNKVKWAQKRQRLLWMLMFTWGRQINRCHVLNTMWTTSLTCAEVAGIVRTLPVGVHLARRLGCLRSLLCYSVVTSQRMQAINYSAWCKWNTSACENHSTQERQAILLALQSLRKNGNYS